MWAAPPPLKRRLPHQGRRSLARDRGEDSGEASIKRSALGEAVEGHSRLGPPPLGWGRGPGASWADWSSHPVDRQQLLDPKSNGVWNLPLADRSGCPVEEQGIQHKDRATLQFAAPPRGIKVGPRPWRAGQDPPSREYSERGVSAGCLELRPPPAPPDRRERRTGMAVAQGEVRPAALKGHT
ncbi:hypothetical protein NDU88_003924 [Pleurodeles waltl]|uniref:Uncharacterized protein n=1 Tax=Pleurodeles waltl TaxID=8319 RepID=A0AAV7W6M9_PLEWA|nr:hypothetical protein NDU88_003924 [Pleurodeles waltl]